ncbi:copper resistance CopC/CopD family protein [Nocardioides aestuarii]|uniref:Copper resistance protein CopC n=1 Tax=Nocardioides aestuarii TaxID=252231 RepID=A0ABW4TKL4_9ACTN
MRSRLALAVLLGVLALLGTAAPAAAHAQLVATDPADGALLETAPSEVTLTFDEPVRLTAQEITVYDADGATVPSSARTTGTDVVITLDDPSSLRGTHVVGWFVVSADGHPISGSLTFSVGERSEDVAEPPPPPTSSRVVTTTQGVLAGLTYLGLLTAAGLVLFASLLLPTSYDGPVLRRRLRTLARAAAAVAALGVVLAVPVAAVYAQGAELPAVLEGLDLAAVRDELVSAALVVAGLGAAVSLLGDTTPAGPRRWLAPAAAAVALLGPVVVGHTRAYQPTSLLVASDAVHLLAGATWLGGLVGLWLSLRALAGRERLAAETLARFSTVAGGLVLAVAATGTVLAWRILDGWAPFVGTTYGRLLLVKIGLALVVAGLGGWNRFRLLPRVRAAAGHDDRTATAGAVTRTVRVEALVVVVLLAVTGFLVNQSPRPAPVTVPEGRTGVQDGSVSDLEVLVLLSPRREGRTTLLVQLQDETGEPVVTDRTPDVQLRTSGLDLGSVPVQPTDAGTWSADVLLPQPGTWEVQVGLRLSKFENPVTTVRFEVAPQE